VIDPNGQITSVEVYYDQPPLNSGDEIDIHISYENESASGSGLNSYVYLTAITSSNYTNSKYTILDGQGIVCKKMALALTSAINPSGSPIWKPIIRKVVINYEPSIIL
jgi:hypothetical protein